MFFIMDITCLLGCPGFLCRVLTQTVEERAAVVTCVANTASDFRLIPETVGEPWLAAAVVRSS